MLLNRLWLILYLYAAPRALRLLSTELQDLVGLRQVALLDKRRVVFVSDSNRFRGEDNKGDDRHAKNRGLYRMVPKPPHFRRSRGLSM